MLTLVGCIALLAIHTTRAANTCYFKNSKTPAVQVAWNSYPCSNSADIVSCCNNGDICGQDSLCYHPLDSRGSGGYLIGGCTDPTYQAPQCSNRCATFAFQNVAYAQSRNLWGCCGNDSFHCTTPGTSEFFSAISPSSWSALPSPVSTSATSATSSSAAVATSSSITSTSTSTSTSNNPSSSATAASSASNQSNSSGLSTGAKAGIAVGVALVTLICATAIAMAIILKRRKNNSDDSSAPLPREAAGYEGAQPTSRIVEKRTAVARPVTELHAHSAPQELPS